MPESSYVKRRRWISSTLGVTLIAIGSLGAGGAAGQDVTLEAGEPSVEMGGGDAEAQPLARGTAGEPRPAEINLELRGLDGSKVKVNDKVGIAGRLRPFKPGQTVKILLLRDGNVVERATKNLRRVQGSNAGRFRMITGHLIKPGRYVARAIHQPSPELRHAQESTGVFRIRYPDVGSGTSNNIIDVFHELMGKQGYRNAPSGGTFNDASRRAVHAFRKANGMATTWSASSDIFKKLADGKGAYKLRYPGAGRHVEVYLSRQVMVLADGGKPQYTYHVSTGAPSTPTIRGHYRFYSKQPGYNSVGMYYSVYFKGGYATHGYHSVPDYNASHGCVRNPIPDSRFIYNWIHLGDSIYVYD